MLKDFTSLEKNDVYTPFQCTIFFASVTQIHIDQRQKRSQSHHIHRPYNTMNKTEQ